MQHVVIEIDPPGDVYSFGLSEPPSPAAVMQPNLGRQVFSRGVQLVWLVLALIEVVTDFFVQHGD